jgi:thiol:disulfide interchange protein DsbD
MKHILTFFAVILFTGRASAQIVQDPTSWSFEVKKKDAKHFSLIFHTTIKPTWHLYALQPGGDGSLIPISFKFSPANGVKRSGDIKSLTRPVTQAMEGIDGRVNLYSGKADFIQEVVGTSGRVITGIIEYQACNDMMCLPPKKKTFSFTLR